jgi:hypothetical protein
MESGVLRAGNGLLLGGEVEICLSPVGKGIGKMSVLRYPFFGLFTSFTRLSRGIKFQVNRLKAEG